MFSRRSALWRNHDFTRFWAADSISIFGSLITRAALPFTAILLLDATAIQVALLAAADLLPAFLMGLPVGAWVDRLRRKPIMIAADLGRAALLGSIPLAYVFDALIIEHLYAVALLASVCTIFFDVAYLSLLPSIVKREELLEANAKIATTQSVSEVSAFGASGWLVQAVSGPGAILIDACSFVVSAVLLRDIKVVETPPDEEDHLGMRTEIAEGMRGVARDPVLRALAISSLLMAFSSRILGGLITLFAIRELGFEPGVLGTIYAVGGVTSLLGGLSAEPVGRRFGVGPSMIAGVFLFALGMVPLSLAPEFGVVAVAILIGGQLADGPMTINLINETTLTQALAPGKMLGRVNATMRFLGLGAMLAGILTGGILGETIGLRPTLALAAGLAFLSTVALLLSPVRTLRSAPVQLESPRGV
ncbi:MAG: MFS transporter [Dehalococcoidia bacterium]